MGAFSIVLPFLVLVTFFFPQYSRAAEINWSKVRSSNIYLFYPGVSSWEFLNSDDHKLGAREIKKGKKNCGHCHLEMDGGLDLKADEIASGAIRMKRSHKPFEPEPLPGKKGVITTEAQAAYDNDYLYLRFSWDSKGASWSQKGNTPDRVSIQMNKSEQAFRNYGCFITCHNDLSTMPQAPSSGDIGRVYKGRDEARLYAYYAKSSWSERRADADLRSRDGIIDLKSIQFEGGRVSSEDGRVFDDRVWDEKPGFEGAGSWSSGKYIAVFKIKLGSAGRYNVALSEGDVVTIGLAIHDYGTDKRKHYVSLPVSVGLGAREADIEAVKLQN
ncbi:MAG: hypothetical protein A2V21_303905 [Deltaproteobacteria bacterium GWC2_55_46]|nr:MAG: hypothetical protein A2Z79_12835 [Deltaproteobacteria bacterium GWA2_55_82]OGQ62767.1 MAG: hypothetical protein A3I81_11605 [Deltaproteobacteria bacterium RIFCSPLOWO2_02_FULL_55_12]OIJ73484.1 MAG: hypothetical protein A2V21_303905 [Deltaproteobacteria bacterium GWC2_55_46]